MFGDEKKMAEYEGRLYCSKCGRDKQVGNGPIEVLKDAAGHVLGFKCLDCKALWRIEELK